MKVTRCEGLGKIIRTAAGEANVAAPTAPQAAPAAPAAAPAVGVGGDPVKYFHNQLTNIMMQMTKPLMALQNLVTEENMQSVNANQSQVAATEAAAEINALIERLQAQVAVCNKYAQAGGAQAPAAPALAR